MDFPVYVPAAVRAHITTLIEGDSWEPHGWAVSLADANHQLAEIDAAIESQSRRGKVEYLDSLRKQRADAAVHRDLLAGWVECLRRLAHDARMREVYALLSSEFSDEQLRGFVYAAWAASNDYSKYRERLKRAEELKGEISVTAEKLAKLIRQFSDTGIHGPSEFYSVPELLRQTDNHELQDHNLYMWRSMRKYVLGDRPEERYQEAEGEEVRADADLSKPPKITIRFVDGNDREKIDPKEEARNSLGYAWGVAPDLSALLDTVAEAAREFTPSESGMIGAAIDSRQTNEKTQYIRAFANLLIDVHHISLTNTVMRAMAIVANVAINRPDDIDVTIGDVRQTLKNLTGKSDV